MQVTISGTPVTIVPLSLNISDAIGQRSVASFTVQDAAGASHFLAGQPVIVRDDSGFVVYSGYIFKAKRATGSSYSNLLLHQVTCQDQHYPADKRIAATSYASQTCGFMVNDLVTNWLAAEGVGTRNNLLSVNQSNVETDTTGFTAVLSATLTRDTTQHWQGAASLKSVTPGSVSGEGFRATLALTAYHAGDALVLSGYLTGTGTVALSCVRTDTGALIGAASAPTVLTGAFQRVSIAVTLPTTLPTSGQIGLQVLTTSTQAVTFYADGLQIEQAYAATPWVVGQTSYVQAGPLVTSYVVNYKQVSTALDDLAKLAGFYWVIDAAKVLHFAASITNVSPWTFDGTQALDGMAAIEDTSPLYRNAQYELGATEITSAQTETHKGDGSTRVFPTSFPIHAVPSNIHIDAGAAQTIGILGIDAPGSKQWYWNKGIAQITQDSTGTVLSTANVVSITYVGEFKVVALASDVAQQVTEQSIEGGVGTGIVENVVADASLITAVQAFQNAGALLTKFSTTGQVLTFRTKTVGLAAGQLLTVNLPTPWSFTGKHVLIESVTITYDDFFFWWDVKALLGPVNSNWVQFFQALADVQTPIDLAASGGLQSTVAILNPTNETWTWTESATPVVTACQLFTITFPKTFC